ncbi:Conserved_hypothetical protein [Hexamita inflata]|uniref:Uncharacterized protein n=1 Tax=Hexamita inflata TaxID=28002 RepID=A0AA86PTL4_9EUKA|nr:Conserved hypothetical protein [Hexamita inflata]
MLKVLNLSNNQIKDIADIESLKDLVTLNLINNKITSFKIVLQNLINLSIGMNPLKDKSGLHQSPHLQYLDLSETKTTNTNFIPQQLTNLRTLQLCCNNISDIATISNYIDLQSLNLTFNKFLKNIEPLKCCMQLINLDLSNTRVYDINPLQFLRNLQFLKLSRTNVSNLWPLQFVKNLKQLIMSYISVIDLHPLQYLHQLEHLQITNTKVVDVAPLSSLTLISQMLLVHNKIRSFDPVKHHKCFTDYSMGYQTKPTAQELKFYNKILSVHSSHKQIRKIMNDNKIAKFKTYLAQKENYISIMLNKQIQILNKQLEMLIQVVQFSYLD